MTLGMPREFKVTKLDPMIFIILSQQKRNMF